MNRNSTPPQEYQVVYWHYQTNQGETKTAFRHDYPDKPKKCWQSTNKIKGQPYPLYYDQIPEDKEEFIVVLEGEKCCDYFRSNWGWFATTSIGGCQAVKNTDWTPLEGYQNIILWRDNDKPGMAWQESIGTILTELGCTLYQVEIPTDKPESWDCADATKSEIEDLVIAASKRKPWTSHVWQFWG